MSSETMSGPYLGLDAGLTLATGIKVDNHNNGIPSRCDLHYAGQAGFPADASAFRADSGNPSCVDFPGTHLRQDYNKTSLGHTVGLTVGYGRIWGLPVRAEFEYFYRNNEFDKRAPVTVSGGKLSEFVPSAGGQAYGRFGGVQSHNIFANLYYDLQTDTKFTPYLGGGVGWSKTKADLLNFFQRNDNGDNSSALCGRDDDPTPANDCVIGPLEGTVSYSRRNHEDGLFGFQVLLGFDYSLS